MAFLKLVPIRFWFYLGVIVAVLGVVTWFKYHEIGIGEAKCEAKYTEAQVKEREKKAAAQAKLDADAAHDAALRAALNAPVPHAQLTLPGDCKLSAAQLDAIKGALQ